MRANCQSRPVQLPAHRPSKPLSDPYQRINQLTNVNAADFREAGGAGEKDG